MVYNIQNNNVLRYLCDIIAPSIQTTTVIRNGRDIIIPFCRLSITYYSFIPSTIYTSMEWLRLITSICGLYRKILNWIKKTEKILVSKHYEIGPRKLNIALTKDLYSRTI